MEYPRATYAQRVMLAPDADHLDAMEYAALSTGAALEVLPADTPAETLNTALYYGRVGGEQQDAAYSEACTSMCLGGAVVRVEVRRNYNQEPANLDAFDACYHKTMTDLACLRSIIARVLNPTYTVNIM
ncbi:MAG TPA: hypothetical protein VFB59_05070 [Candidatus Saccharimonadales bacterium]|nr:hypothetical protein [Candidatus Saccharimonadales bacterium]